MIDYTSKPHASKQRGDVGGSGGLGDDRRRAGFARIGASPGAGLVGPGRVDQCFSGHAGGAERLHVEPVVAECFAVHGVGVADVGGDGCHLLRLHVRLLLVAPAAP